MASKAVKSLISTSIVRYDKQMPGAMTVKKGKEACRRDLMERGKNLIEEIVKDAQAKKEYNNNFDDRKKRMTDAVRGKGEWLSEEDITELLALFDAVDESSSESSNDSGSSSDQKPAKRQRVVEKPPETIVAKVLPKIDPVVSETVVAEAVPVNPKTDPLDSETVVAEPSDGRRDFKIDDGTVEAVEKLMNFNKNKRELDYVLQHNATLNEPMVWKVLSTACQHIYLSLHEESPDQQYIEELQSFVMHRVDEMRIYAKLDATDMQEQLPPDSFLVNFEELDKIAANIYDEVCAEDWDNVVKVVHGVDELNRTDKIENSQDRVNAYLTYIIHNCNYFQVQDEPDPEGPLMLAVLLSS